MCRKENTSKNIGEKMTDFDLFWKAYPKKVAKADARKAWEQTKSIRPDVKTVIEAVQNACKTEQWMRGNGQFIPYAATWLRGERWEDEFEVKLPGVINEKPWHETWAGIVAKGREHGIYEESFSHPQSFKAEVIRVVGDKLKAA
jgi:hypothetical protein